MIVLLTGSVVLNLLLLGIISELVRRGRPSQL